MSYGQALHHLPVGGWCNFFNDPWLGRMGDFSTAGQKHPYFVKFTPYTTVPMFIALLHQIKLYETDKCEKTDLINGDVI
jgi:hypothetical protein